MTLPTDEQVVKRLRTAQALGFDNIASLRDWERYLAYKAGLRV